MSRFEARAGERLHWRAHMRTSGALDPSRPSHALSWHLVECADPTHVESHCPVGVDLLNIGADPDGHCLVDGTCPRCALANAPAAAPAIIQASTPVAADGPVEA